MFKAAFEKHLAQKFKLSFFFFFTLPLKKIQLCGKKKKKKPQKFMMLRP